MTLSIKCNVHHANLGSFFPKNMIITQKKTVGYDNIYLLKLINIQISQIYTN
jgi:hypothetical protein